jgi:hypothetical protein
MPDPPDLANEPGPHSANGGRIPGNQAYGFAFCVPESRRQFLKKAKTGACKLEIGFASVLLRRAAGVATRFG